MHTFGCNSYPLARIQKDLLVGRSFPSRENITNHSETLLMLRKHLLLTNLFFQQSLRSAPHIVSTNYPINSGWKTGSKNIGVASCALSLEWSQRILGWTPRSGYGRGRRHPRTRWIDPIEIYAGGGWQETAKDEAL